MLDFDYVSSYMCAIMLKIDFIYGCILEKETTQNESTWMSVYRLLF